ncbi:SDR family oxidoreductase [Sphingomonas sp.]|uniref:SDR family oxidoreductase n=1 Tax=Sphingomonas sp. TaxID=28214 RepID=UPI002D7FFD0A|nr:NAD(P)H-binding protein [Sphingomonas sp.]HEU0045215.1 NAD(P)H-binding protein [Sphingomonas sp.]
MILALTGATGFVGGHVLDQALAAGHQVRALTRRPQAERMGVTWIAGDLASSGRFAQGADAVVHVAGVVNAPDRAGFAAGNVDGTRRMLAAARDAGVRRFVHVSSLAAREPGLSAYGWSKAEAEKRVEDSDLDWTIVRPPAVFGPGDLEMLDMFRLARRHVVPLPPRGRLSVIAVEDLAALLLALAATSGPRTIYEADDGTGGWTHDGFARAIGRAVGKRVLPLPLPGLLLSAAAAIDAALRGPGAKLTPDRVAYFRHPDWTIDPARRPPAALWQPVQPTGDALARTAAWYRTQGLL